MGGVSTLAGPDVSQFQVGGTCANRGQAAPLAKSETCTVIVGFKPTATGAKSVTLTTVTNGPAFTTGAITGFGRKLAAKSYPRTSVASTSGRRSSAR